MQAKDVRKAIIALINDKNYRPLSAEAMLEAMQGEMPADKFWRELLSLEQEGTVLKNRKGLYGTPESLGFTAGRFQASFRGFGFVVPDNKVTELAQPDGTYIKLEKPDIFIPASATGMAMNNDRVLVRITAAAEGKRPEGEIAKVISHANNRFVGIFHQSKDFGFVVPDGKYQDIYIMRKHFRGAKDGQKVVVEITEWPHEQRKAEGKIIEVLGNVGDVGLEILSIIKQHDLPLEFPASVIAASQKVPESIKKTELRGRKDRRDRLIVTIDGEDAKDLDDAVYVEKLNADEYLLGVYIADVSYYVRENSVLDKEARERGTSVYLVDRVLPMLPERLSNGICSLNAGEDRLAMACEMHINSDGKVLGYEIFPTVINVRHRLSYNIVRSIIGGDEKLRVQYADAVPMLEQAEELRVILRRMRRNRGGVDFDLPELKVILDEDLKPVEIVKRIHGDAENLIEEFMLAANETVAKHMFAKQYPLMYRVHDLPNVTKMQELAKLLANFNVKFARGEKVKPQDLQRVLTAMEGRPELRLVSTVALRSMKQAIYQTENIGHFGLAAEYYCHFTSPIRRYPDLTVHRMLRKWMQQPLLNKEEQESVTDKLDEMAQHSSERERAAAEAERATVKLKECEYMADHIGEEFDGVISGVTSFGIFVELENGVEGLVHISAMTEDYFAFEEDRYALIGERTGKQYRLGDPVRIEVLQVNIEEVSIDFILAGENASAREQIRSLLSARQNQHNALQRRKLAEKSRNGDTATATGRRRSQRAKAEGSRSGRRSKNGAESSNRSVRAKAKGQNAPRGSRRGKKK